MFRKKDFTAVVLLQDDTNGYWKNYELDSGGYEIVYEVGDIITLNNKKFKLAEV